MDSQYYRRVGNRQTLKRLDSGMEITRATKHEPIDLEVISNEELRVLTDDRNGSKFLAEWTLETYVDWLELQIERLAWRFPPGVQKRVSIRVNRPVGYVLGKIVHTVTITASGRWVHAYPDEDAP